MMTTISINPPTPSAKGGVMIALLGSSERSGWFHPLNLGPLLGAISGLQRPVSLELILDYRPHSKARNESVRRFLASSCRWLIQFDNDVVLQPGWERLISLAEEDRSKLALTIPYPVPTGTYKSWVLAYGVGQWTHEKGNPYGLEWTSSLPDGWSAWDVATGGTLMLHRSVFEKLAAPYFAELAESVQKACPGEEVTFCKRLARIGIKVHAHSDYVASHYHTVDLLSLMHSN